MGFKQALDHILRVEGGLVENPADPGGRTNFGVTQGTFSKWLREKSLPATDVAEIQREEVWSIYHDNYWKEGQCDKLPWPLSLYHFDGYVNLLPRDAGRVLQRALKIHAPELVVDGIVGPKTIRTANNLEFDPKVRSEYLWERIRLYLRKVKANKKKLEFLPSWMWRLDKLRKVYFIHPPPSSIRYGGTPETRHRPLTFFTTRRYSV